MASYEKSVVCQSSDSGRRVVEDAFVQAGFQIADQSADGFEVKGPGMHSSNQNPIVGVSTARIRASNRELSIEAELGGVRGMQLFIYLFPFALCEGLGVLFFFLSRGEAGEELSLRAAFIPLLWAVPWLFIAPVLSGALKRKTTRAINTLLDDDATLSGRD